MGFRVWGFMRERVQVVIYYMLRAQRDPQVIALGPMYILYSYMEGLGFRLRFRAPAYALNPKHSGFGVEGLGQGFRVCRRCVY